jgi:hypothetical protein
MSSIRETLALWKDSFSLTLMLESERDQGFAGLLESLLDWFRLLLRQPTILSSSLRRELDTRGYSEGEVVISSQTLRIVDHSYFRATGSKVRSRVCCCGEGDLLANLPPPFSSSEDSSQLPYTLKSWRGRLPWRKV